MSVSLRIDKILFAMAGTVLALLPARLAAHDMPADAVVQMFVRPAAGRVQVLVRLPLASLLNINLPKRSEDYLDLAHIEPGLEDAGKATADIIDLYQGEAKLQPAKVSGVQISLPSDQSFESFDGANAHIAGERLPVDTNVVWDQGFFDVLLDYPSRPGRSDFSVHPHFEAVAARVTVVLRFIDGDNVRAFDLSGDPGLVRLDPRWYQAALTFVRAGFEHILSGTDHLLFLFCLVIPVRRLWNLISIVTSFTAAHSITLIASAYQIAPSATWFPPLIETIIAVSIVYMALENVLVAKLTHRWMISFGFGLIHGFGFSFALRQTLQFAGSHLLASLLSFNLGVELGQILVLCTLMPLLAFCYRIAISERTVIIVLSLIAGHVAWHWMADRVAILTKLPWTARDFVKLGHWIAGAIFLACILGVALIAFRRFMEAGRYRGRSIAVGEELASRG